VQYVESGVKPQIVLHIFKGILGSINRSSLF